MLQQRIKDQRDLLGRLTKDARELGVKRGQGESKTEQVQTELDEAFDKAFDLVKPALVELRRLEDETHLEGSASLLPFYLGGASVQESRVARLLVFYCAYSSFCGRMCRSLSGGPRGYGYAVSTPHMMRGLGCRLAPLGQIAYARASRARGSWGSDVTMS